MDTLTLRILQFLLVCLPPIACFATHGVIWVLVGLALLRLSLGHHSVKELASPFISLSFFPFFMWALLSLLWSIAPEKTLTLTGKLILLSIGGILSIDLFKNTKPQDQQTLILPFLVSFFITIILYNIDTCFEFWQHYQGYWSPTKTYGQWSVFLALCFWPVFKLCKESTLPLKFLWAWIGFCSITLMTNRYYCDSAWLGWVFSLAGLGIYTILPVKVFYNLGRVTLLLGIFIFPILFLFLDDPATLKDINIFLLQLGIGDPSFMQRVYIWVEAKRLAIESPWLGYGLDSARYVGQKYVTYPFLNKTTELTLSFQQIPTHTHNSPLQVWLELGIIGLILFSIMLCQILKKICELPKKEGVYFLGLMLTSLPIAWFNVGIWQNWWIGSLFLCTGLLYLSNKNVSQAS